MTCTCSEMVFRPSGLTSGGGEGGCATSARGESTTTANSSPPRVRRILPPAGCRGWVRRRFAPDVSQIARRPASALSIRTPWLLTARTDRSGGRGSKRSGDSSGSAPELPADAYVAAGGAVVAAVLADEGAVAALRARCAGEHWCGALRG